VGARLGDLEDGVHLDRDFEGQAGRGNAGNGASSRIAEDLPQQLIARRNDLVRDGGAWRGIDQSKYTGRLTDRIAG